MFLLIIVISLCAYQCQAREGGGGGGRATHGNLTVICIPRVGILIICSYNYKEQKRSKAYF